MDETKEAIKKQTLEELRDYYAGNPPGSTLGHYASVEFQYRQAKFYERQTEAVEKQAEASIGSYKSMKKDSRMMLWSLIFIALSAISTLIIAISNLPSN